ncbi:hypothetical protein BBM86_11730 [Vibrio parahaemolyticus]|nr:hypothetical protein BBM86_11730 [Vibrio parahaemolyticus]
MVDLENGTIAKRKVESGYNYRSISKIATSRYKSLANCKLSLKFYNDQVEEIMANVKAIKIIYESKLIDTI